MSGTGNLVKIGDGTLTLTAANLYSGGTTVGSGTLDLTGSVASDVAVSHPN
jgi:fibronectin-binding autotransporter adhesin